MLLVVYGFGKGRVQGRVNGGGRISHGAADSQVGSSLLCQVCAVDALRAEEDVHNSLGFLCSISTTVTVLDSDVGTCSSVAVVSNHLQTASSKCNIELLPDIV